MSFTRDKERDKAETRKRIRSRAGRAQAVDKNWLGHGDKAAQLDILLLDGATMDELREVRPTAQDHIAHLRREHNLIVTKGEIRMFDRQHLGIDP